LQDAPTEGGRTEDDASPPGFAEAGAGPLADAAAPDALTTDATIACGANVCTGGLVCCMTSPTDLVCAVTCAAGALTIRCDDPKDCGDGEVCCGFGWAIGPPGDVQCTARAACEGFRDAPRCIKGEPNTCLAPTTCQSDETSTGYPFQ